ncbi:MULTISPECIES: phage tail terminator protein [Idiomarina]|uniref:phage tail terminator protein n=1 Tax=Idiomarina TaxID=135575 RepID=UPI00129AA92F|nr:MULTISPECIES: hypothetical protein [Idiomarina]MRJ40825.1 hypothetical protein [Idiomarina sp. FeN1]NCU56629.1 hypothetical protein [Idiomarina sp. FenA--70]NCU59009.1 hypothetical protein [Idiomarina sp. FenBw--71]UUN14495.1 hypothetical protein KGF88_04585 [Idiomarina loihiensis]
MELSAVDLLDVVEQRLAAIQVDGNKLFRNIEQAVDASTILDNTQVKADGAFVVPIDDGGQSNERTTGRYSQLIRERFGVLIACRSINDPLGSNVNRRLATMKKQVRAALAGFEPGGSYESIQFEQGSLFEFRKGGVLWIEEYSVEYIYEGES